MKRTGLTVGPAAVLMGFLLAALATLAPAGLRAQGGGAAGQAGQGGQPPAPPQNLQVLPKDISRADLNNTMREFAFGLGVQCNYCHVREGQGGRNDMAADDKQPKKTARVMLQMMTHVNEMLATGIGKPAAEVTKVHCYTCHRGEAIPKTPDPPAPTPQGQAPRP